MFVYKVEAIIIFKRIICGPPLKIETYMRITNFLFVKEIKLQQQQ
jgi:hypothetical protein